VDPRADLDDEGKKFLTLPGLEPRPLGRPARSQSLYRLRYPTLPRLPTVYRRPITKLKCFLKELLFSINTRICLTLKVTKEIRRKLK
jgi:hypothetical protein